MNLTPSVKVPMSCREEGVNAEQGRDIMEIVLKTIFVSSSVLPLYGAMRKILNIVSRALEGTVDLS